MRNLHIHVEEEYRRENITELWKLEKLSRNSRQWKPQKICPNDDCPSQYEADKQHQNSKEFKHHKKGWKTTEEWKNQVDQ